MTIEEVIEILKEILELDDSIYQFNPVYLKTLKMAIRSLEALPKIREEIAEAREVYVDGTPVLASKFDLALDIIDRHLKEVQG